LLNFYSTFKKTEIKVPKFIFAELEPKNIFIETLNSMILRFKKKIKQILLQKPALRLTSSYFKWKNLGLSLKDLEFQNSTRIKHVTSVFDYPNFKKKTS